MFHMCSREEGGIHNMILYRNSGKDQIMSNSLNKDSRKLYIYVDPSYVLRAWLIIGYIRATETVD